MGTLKIPSLEFFKSQSESLLLCSHFSSTDAWKWPGIFVRQGNLDFSKVPEHPRHHV